MNITVYDYAEHIGEALAWTSPSKGGSPVRKKGGSIQGPPPVGGQLLYTHLKQAAMFGGDSNSRWCAAQCCRLQSLYQMGCVLLPVSRTHDLAVSQGHNFSAPCSNMTQGCCVCLIGRTGCISGYRNAQIPAAYKAARMAKALPSFRTLRRCAGLTGRTGCGTR